MVNDMRLAVEAQRREDAREPDGRFGEHELGSSPELELDPQPTWAVTKPDPEIIGLADLVRLAIQTRTLNRVIRESERRARQKTDEPEAHAAEEVKRRWYSRFLDTALRYTHPDGYYDPKRLLKNALTKGGLVCAAILCFVIPAEYAGDHGLGVREDAISAPPRWQMEYPGLAAEYECSMNGLSEGTDAIHAIVLDKTVDPEPTIKVVSFERGWKIYQSGRDDLALIAVCAK